MIVQAKKAKGKFCCDGGANEGDEYVCLADDCMAWRWCSELNAADGTEGSDRRGYCGLAGAL